MGTQSLFSALERAHLPEALVLASTGALYEPSPQPHREDSSFAPDDVDGLSRLWAEQAARLLHRRTGVPVGVARLFNMVGPRENNRHLVPEIVVQARRGSELRLGTWTPGATTSTWTTWRGAFTRWAKPFRRGLARVNLGAGCAVDGHELIEQVGELLGRRLSVTNDPERVRASDRPVLQSDPSAARELLGWEAATSLRDALSGAL